MTTIKVKQQNAQNAWENADEQGKKMLENLFPDVTFKPIDIKDRVKTLQDAIDIVKPGENTLILLKYNGVDPIMIGAQAAAQLFIIAQALNEGWEADWEDFNQNKYYSYFRQKSGVGLSYYVYDCDFSDTYVGSRLVFKSADLAMYAANQFHKIYQNFLQK